MRFDDMIETVLAQPADRPDRQAARWRQLADLLAQRPGGHDGAYKLLRADRSAIAPAERRRVARALAGRRIAPDLLAFFAEDSASIAAPLIARARLEREDWLTLLPRLGPAARALLRHRDDLAPEVRHALSAFGPSDLVLESRAPVPLAAPPPAPLPAPSEGSGDSQIRELVARIEAFRRQRVEPAPVAMPAGTDLEGFRWETGTDGIIIWVEGAPIAARWSGRAWPPPRSARRTASTARRPARSKRRRRSAMPASASPAPARPAATGGFRACPGSIRASAASRAIAAPRAGHAATRSPASLRPPACSEPNSPPIRCAS
jgi:hypothetical protein